MSSSAYGHIHNYVSAALSYYQHDITWFFFSSLNYISLFILWVDFQFCFMFQASMDLPADKAKLLKQYDNEKKWDIICDEVRDFILFSSL